MTFYEELYFEITMRGPKSELKKIVSAIRSGELSDFFEVTPELFIFDDSYAEADGTDTTEVIFTTDDYGIKIDELDCEEFLEVLCKLGRRVDVYGTVYDVDEEEFSFKSEPGDSYYVNSRITPIFNDELDAAARDEEDSED